MTVRRRPVTVSCRVTLEEKRLVQAAAAGEGLPVSEFIHSRLVPEVKRIMARSLGAPTPNEPLARTVPFAQQIWSLVGKQQADGHFQRIVSFETSACEHCGEHTLWLMTAESDVSTRIVWPATSLGPRPCSELPEEVTSDFEEARAIVGSSPRGAAALLRLCVQKLCMELGEPGEHLNADIGALVNRGLPEKIQQSLDTVRVVGNNAVHPGELDLRDDLDMALQLFELVNLIAEVMITQPKRVEALYDRVMSPGQKEQVEKRDGANDGE